MQWRVVLALCAIIALGLAYGWGRFDGRAAERARADAALLDQVAAAQARERGLVVQVDRVARDALEREQELAALAADADADLRRLQRAIAGSDRGAGAAPAPVADGAAVAGYLAECAGSLVAVAKRADGYARQLIGLQDYVAQVCQGDR